MSNYKELQRRPTRDALEQLLAEIAPGGKITRVTRLRGGISCGMHGVNITEKSGAKLRIVVRRYNDWWARRDPDVARREFKTLQLLAGADIPAPRPVWVQADADVFGAPTIVQSWLSGKATLMPTNLDRWTTRLAEGLATLHNASFKNAETAYLDNYSDRLHDEISGEKFRASRARHPLGTRVLKVIDDNWPAMPARSLLHTDYWPGNTVWSRGKLTGIVDWEMPSLGEPAYDVAYCRQDLMWLFGPEVADNFQLRYQDIRGSRIENPAFWDLLVATRAMPKPSYWLPGYLDLGRTDMTMRSMSIRFTKFIQQALTAI